MKKLIRFFSIVLLSLLALIIMILTILSIKYSPRYVYRLARYHVADVYDYTHFENRDIEASAGTFTFPVRLEEDYVESLFQDRVIASGLSSFDEWAVKSQTTALIVIRRDTILYEKYFNGFSRDSYFHSQSVAKSFISLLIGFAVEDGYIQSIEDPMTDYVPELLERDRHFGRITIRNLLMMRSGLKYNEAYLPGIGIHAPWHDEAVGYYHGNVRKLLLKRMEVDGEPGKYFQYNNYNTSFLGLIIERATGKTVSAYLEEKLWSRIMEYGALFSIDSKRSGFEYMPSRLMARAIDYARFGRLFLHEGNWNGSQIISHGWVRESTTEDTTVSREFYPKWMGSGCQRTYYKYQWWGHTNCDSSYRFFASGNLGQNIYILPKEETIIVHCGNSLEHYNTDLLRNVSERIK
ncbi:MAG: serine hydrolase [Bacteroidota bacterium]|nr:serine hydrolase [Bacteroidota bacterium]